MAAILLLGVGCQHGENIPEARMPVSAPEPASELTTTTTEAVTTTTEPATTTTEPEPAPTILPRRPVPTSPPTSQYLQPVATTGSGACGGDLPPCYVMMRESGGDPTIWNKSGSGASGKWQFMPGTWAGYGGYAHAAYAPESVQDEKARIVWDGGRGCRHWDAC